MRYNKCRKEKIQRLVGRCRGKPSYGLAAGSFKMAAERAFFARQNMNAKKRKPAMKKTVFRKGWVIFASLLLLLLPAVVFAQTYGANSRQPPIAQQLVREGNLAIQLTAALGLGTYDNEAEAESILGNAGIVPRNGWVADYPVTPDIIGELEKSVGAAADAHKIALSRDEALKRLRDVNAGLMLAVSPYSVDQRAGVPPAEAEIYPDQAVLDEYYTTEGPPVVTYYAPPPYYNYLYSWVPYPFWYADFGFSGFFILNDFHRQCFFGNGVFFVSNHFRDFRSNRVFRINPVGRFHGRTFAGIGVNNRHGFNSAGVQRGGRHDLNGSRTNGSQAFRRGGPAARTGAPAFRSGNPAFQRGGRTAAVQSSGTRMNASFAHSSMRSMGSPSFGGGRMAGQTFSGGARGGGSSMHGGFGGSSGRGGGGRR